VRLQANVIVCGAAAAGTSWNALKNAAKQGRGPDLIVQKQNTRPPTPTHLRLVTGVRIEWLLGYHFPSSHRRPI
jgi:hypothetical protein